MSTTTLSPLIGQDQISDVTFIVIGDSVIDRYRIERKGPFNINSQLINVRHLRNIERQSLMVK